MNCDSVTKSMSFNMSSSGHGGNPTVNNVNCGKVANPDLARISGASTSAWSWSATLQNFPDGVLTITLANPAAVDGNSSTGVRFFLVSLRLLMSVLTHSF
jgi:alpha-1,3-glucan synthase